MKFNLAQIKESVDCRWIAFFIILIFPMLGNALNYGWLEMRRPIQLILLLGASVTLFVSLKKDNFLNLKPYIKIPLIFTTFTAVISFGCLLLFTDEFVGLGWLSMRKAFFTFFYLFVFVFTAYYLWLNRVYIKKTLSSQKPVESSSLVAAVISLLGLLIVFKAWWIGPLELQAHIDFGGSTTIVGLCSTSAFFVILFALPARFFIRFLVGLPYLYLLFFSTSRTAYVVFFTLWVLYAFHVFLTAFRVQGFRGFLYRLLTSTIPLIALIVIIVPLKLSSRQYPFHISKDVKENIWTYEGRSAEMKQVGYEKLIIYRQEELWNRLSRFIRALYNFYQSPVITDFREAVNDIFQVDLMPDILVGAEDYMILGGHNPDDRWARLAAQSTRSESRTQIIRKTYRLIQERPQGWWPTPYPQAIDFFCNKGKKCQYPHNLILEASFYFGLFIGLLYFIFLGYLSIIFVKLAVKGKNSLIVGFAVSILVHFFGAQFTGTFYELVITAFLLMILLVFLSVEVEKGKKLSS